MECYYKKLNFSIEFGEVGRALSLGLFSERQIMEKVKSLYRKWKKKFQKMLVL